VNENDDKMNSDERACPWCAESIKKKALVCKHCNREVPADAAADVDPDVDATELTPEQPVSSALPIPALPTVALPTAAPNAPSAAKSKKGWGIALIVFGGFCLLIGGASNIITLLLFVLAPLGFGISLVLKANRDRNAAASGETSVSQPGDGAITSFAEKVAVASTAIATNTKSLFSTKKRAYLSSGVIALVLLLTIIGSVNAAANESARVQAAAVVAQQEAAAAEEVAAARDAQALENAIDDGGVSLAAAETRYTESAAWSNDTNRKALQDAAEELRAALETKNTDTIISADKKVQIAFDTVGTQAEADAAAAQAAADAAAAEIASATPSQRNALDKAGSYLDYSSFSRSGLIAQLKYEGYSTADATWGVNHATVDWNEQAALKAKSYLDMSSFSRSGLIDQLLFEGFTAKQANYGVSKTGL
jgi:hypothetical protein